MAIMTELDEAIRDSLGPPRARTTQPDSMPVCGRCQDEGWVCENHPNEAWPSLCQCGAGMPCPGCNSPPKELRSIKPMTDSILSAEELAIKITQPYGYYTCDFKMAHQDVIGLIERDREAVRNSALEDAIHQVSGFDFNTCVTIRERIEALKTPSKEEK